MTRPLIMRPHSLLFPYYGLSYDPLPPSALLRLMEIPRHTSVAHQRMTVDVDRFCSAINVQNPFLFVVRFSFSLLASVERDSDNNLRPEYERNSSSFCASSPPSCLPLVRVTLVPLLPVPALKKVV